MNRFGAMVVRWPALVGAALMMSACGGSGGGSAPPTPTPPAANLPPAANAGTDQLVLVGATVNLGGSGTDADGTITTWAWTQASGTAVTLSAANTATPNFTAPAAATALVFELSVTDNSGATRTDTVTVNVNAPPVANAGTDQTVNAGANVTLQGSATDANGTIASYAWTQTAGPAVTMTGASTATLAFTAPATAADSLVPAHRDGQPAGDAHRQRRRHRQFTFRSCHRASAHEPTRCPGWISADVPRGDGREPQLRMARQRLRHHRQNGARAVPASSRRPRACWRTLLLRRREQRRRQRDQRSGLHHRRGPDRKSRSVGSRARGSLSHCRRIRRNVVWHRADGSRAASPDPPCSAATAHPSIASRRRLTAACSAAVFGGRRSMGRWCRTTRCYRWDSTRFR